MPNRPWLTAGLSIAGGLLAPAHAGAVVYGVDDRIEVHEHPSEAWRQLAQTSILAMGRSSWMICGDEPELLIPELTLGEHRELCEGQPFEDQPVLGRCSATLIDRDLVATAHHCIHDGETGASQCPTTVFSPGAYYAEDGTLVAPSAAQIYGCRQIVAEAKDVDISIVQLDRPMAEPYAPATLGAIPVALDDPLGVIGFPDSIPMKIAGGCSVLSRTPSLALNNCDTFKGNSGSGVFHGETLELVAVVRGGPGDYRQEGDCRIVNTLTEEGLIRGIPSAPQLASATPIELVLPSLCDSGWPTPICGGAASCGDGWCTGEETVSSCAEDCSDAECGDEVCEVLTELDCEEDCGHLTVECPSEEPGTTGGPGDSSGGETGLDDTGAGQTDTTGGPMPPAGTTTTMTDTGDGIGGASIDDEAGGCGCRAPGLPRGGWLMAVMLGLGLRRRRRPRPTSSTR